MQVLSRLLPEKVIDLCNHEIDAYLKQRLWSLSNTTWGSSLHEGITGTCMAAAPTPTTCMKIRSAIIDHLPDSKELNLNYHYWNKHSGINWHTDEGHIFGATLYLNDWDKRWGGLFLWEDKDKEIHCVCPTAGTLIINTEYEEHSVTQVSSSARYPRRAIQIWGK